MGATVYKRRTRGGSGRYRYPTLEIAARGSQALDDLDRWNDDVVRISKRLCNRRKNGTVADVQDPAAAAAGNG